MRTSITAQTLFKTLTFWLKARQISRVLATQKSRSYIMAGGGDNADLLAMGFAPRSVLSWLQQHTMTRGRKLVVLWGRSNGLPGSAFHFTVSKWQLMGGPSR